jgi:transcriptional regulator with XRE-family HTH domain
MDTTEVVAWNLRRLRVRLNLSQEALGLRADVDRTYVGRLERGLENPTIAVLDKLAKAIGVPVSELFHLPRSHDPRPMPLRGGRRALRKRKANK